MDNDALTQLIDARLQLQLGNFNMPPSPTTYHNGWDNNTLDPITALSGFPVYQVTDASVAPTDLLEQGKFRFQVDFSGGTPHAYLWAYLIYKNNASLQIAKWWGVALT